MNIKRWISTCLRQSQLAIGASILLALPLTADDCSLVNRDVADRAVEVLRRATVLVKTDWFDQIQITKAEWVRDGFLYRVEINGEHRLDLSQVYILSENGDHFESLGWILSDDCGVPGSPQQIPAQPMAPVLVPRNIPKPGGLTEPFIGILEVPKLLGGFYEGMWTEPSGESLAIYSQTSTLGEIVARIPDTSRVKKVEYGYERSGVVTLEQSQDWFRVFLEPTGSGWIQPSDHGTFHPFEKLIRDGLSYLTSEWDGELFETPSLDSARTAINPEWRQRLGDKIPVETLDTRWLDGRLWLMVDLLPESPCSSNETKVFASGWIPGHSPGGQATVWFYSRGC